MNFEKHEKDGQIFYLVPEKELLRLKELEEDEKDIQDFDKAVLESDIFFPEDLVHRILTGANPVKEYRKFRHMTQEELASQTALSRAYIAQIETGKKTGSVTTLQKIARILNIDITLLLEQE